MDTAVTNIIDSVAEEQKALASIIEAESGKIKLATENYTDNESLICVNKSVESMLTTITKLEMILHSKLQLFDCYICGCSNTTN